MKINDTIRTMAAGLFLICPAYAAVPENLLQDFDQASLIIETSGNHCIVLDIYLANTPQQRARGLMFVRKLGALEGMLFRYAKPSRITMWMKNTYVSLDMVFADAAGTVTGIAAHTEPLSTRRIASPDATTWVLEVNAGFSEQWNIEPGSRLRLLPSAAESPTSVPR